jgi:hypothetical protein
MALGPADWGALQKRVQFRDRQLGDIIQEAVTRGVLVALSSGHGAPPTGEQTPEQMERILTMHTRALGGEVR